MLWGKTGKETESSCTWNISGLCSECIQKEVGDLLAKHNLDVVYSRSGILGKEGN